MWFLPYIKMFDHSKWSSKSTVGHIHNMHFRLRVRIVGSQTYLMWKKQKTKKTADVHRTRHWIFLWRKGNFFFVIVTPWLARQHQCRGVARNPPPLPSLRSITTVCSLVLWVPYSANKMSRGQIKIPLCLYELNMDISRGVCVCGGEGAGGVKEQPFERISVFKNTLILLQWMPFAGRH